MKKMGFVGILILVFTISSCTNTDEIRIGVISPFSGDGAVYGESLKRGVSVALEEIAVKHPELGNRIKLIYEDDQLNSTYAANAINKLIKIDKVQVIIGAFTSNTTLAIAPIAEKNKVVLITPTATNYKIRNAGDYIFRVCPSDDQQGEILAKYAIDNLSAKTASILYMNTDYGFGLKEAFSEIFTDLGGSIILEDGFEQNETDFRTVATKIKSANPDVLFMPSNWQEATNAVNQIHAIGYTPQIICTDGTFEPKFIELTNGNSEGIILSTMAWGVGESKKLAEVFKNQYKNKYNEDPGSYAALCYDAMKVVGKVLEGGARSSDEVREALYDLDYLGATGHNKFDSSGEVNKSFDLYVISHNKFTLIEDPTE